MEPTYDVLALRYASRGGTKSSHFFHYGLYGEPDAPLDLEYYFWVIRDGSGTFLLDCGYNEQQAAAKNRPIRTPAVQLLERVGLRPADIDHVIISHMHFDHVGNLGLFPNATFTMGKPEFDFWTGPDSRRNILSWTVDAADIAVVRSLHADRRIGFVDGSDEVLPGITTTTVPGHTPGQLITAVPTASGQIVLASDALHYYEELEQDRPYAFFHDIQGMFHSYDALRTLAARDGTRVVAGHDPRDLMGFAEVAPDCFDLTRPVSS